VKAAVDDQRGRDVFLLGHSFGGALALEYIRRHGSLGLRGLILVSWIHQPDWIQDFLAMHPDYKEPQIDQALTGNARFRAMVVADAGLYFGPETIELGREVLSRIN